MDFDAQIRALQDDLTHKAKSMQDIKDKCTAEKRSFTEDEKRDLKKYKEECEGLAKKIEALKEEQRLWNAVDADADRFLNEPSEPATRGNAPNSDNVVEAKKLTIPYRSRPTRAFNRLYSTRQEQDMASYRAGLFMQAAFFRNSKAERELQNNHGINVRALSEGTGSAGGFLVPTEMEMGIIDNREQYGVARQWVRVVTLGSDQKHIPAVNGSASASFVSENGTFAESEKSWKNIEVNPKKAGFITRMSSELSEDAIVDVGDDFTREAGRSLALLEDTCVFAGAGTAAHGSIIGVATKFNNDNTLAGAVDLESGDNTFAEVTVLGINGVFAVLPEYAAIDAAIYCSRACNELVFNRLKGTASGNSAQDLNGNFGMNYQGVPIRIVQVMPNTPGEDLENETMFLYGDLSRAVVMGVRRGISISSSGERYFELDQIAFKVSQRFDVVAHDVGTGSVAGPIVAAIGA